MLSKDVLKGIMDLAQTMVSYRKALVENGMAEQDALAMTISYQGQLLAQGRKENLEEKGEAVSPKDKFRILN